MGYADLGCYGGKQIKTPNINRMATEGLRFTDAYSGCTVCAPARSCLMTGFHMGHTSVRGNSGGGFDAGRSHRNFALDDVEEPERPRFKGPVALVIDARCVSAGEGWASWFIAQERARVFGETTAGASSRKRTYTLKNGLHRVTFPVKAYRGSLDRPIERRGLEPDIPMRQNARDLAAGVVADYEAEFPSALACFQDDYEACIAHLRMPITHCRAIRTTNMLERLHEEIRRRSRVVRIFPNPTSLARLVGALILEWDEKWLTGRRYLDMSLLREEGGQRITAAG